MGKKFMALTCSVVACLVSFRAAAQTREPAAVDMLNSIAGLRAQEDHTTRYIIIGVIVLVTLAFLIFLAVKKTSSGVKKKGAEAAPLAKARPRRKMPVWYYIAVVIPFAAYLFMLGAGIANMGDGGDEMRNGAIVGIVALVGICGAVLVCMKKWYGALLAIVPVVVCVVSSLTTRTSWNDDFLEMALVFAVPLLLLLSVIPIVRKATAGGYDARAEAVSGTVTPEDENGAEETARPSSTKKKIILASLIILLAGAGVLVWQLYDDRDYKSNPFGFDGASNMPGLPGGGQPFGAGQPSQDFIQSQLSAAIAGEVVYVGQVDIPSAASCRVSFLLAPDKSSVRNVAIDIKNWQYSYQRQVGPRVKTVTSTVGGLTQTLMGPFPLKEGTVESPFAGLKMSNMTFATDMVSARLTYVYTVEDNEDGFATEKIGVPVAQDAAVHFEIRK